MTLFYVIAGAFVAVTAWWWFIARNVPKYPPLEVSQDDPKIAAAIEKARATLDRFRQLYAQQNGEVQVKVPFLTNGGETEHLWAEVLKLGQSQVDVRYLTPPVTHTGKLDRVHTHPVSDIEDWVVFLESGKIYGGYTQRAMFDIARETYGHIPPELEKQEARYVA